MEGVWTHRETALAGEPADIIAGVYQLLEIIGEGSMGRVYLAHHRLTDQQVAIKVLPSLLASDDERRGRFQSEAKALARLDHPNVVKMHTFLEANDRFYLVMEYVPGVDLDEHMTNAGPMPIDEAVEIARQLLLALGHMHEHGIVHRDVKPGNVRLTPEGLVKLADLGLAKLREKGGERGTLTGTVIGTLAYMSPEQACAIPVDHRADLYSVGVVLFEMLAGRPLFPYENAWEIRRAHVRERPPYFGEVRGEVPTHVSNAVMTALEKSPDQRHADAAAFVDALRDPRVAPVAEVEADPEPVAPTRLRTMIERAVKLAPGPDPPAPASGSGVTAQPGARPAAKGVGLWGVGAILVAVVALAYGLGPCA
jgi:serine/threonine protein kinase